MQDRYGITYYPVSSILGLIESGDIAIPEMQRPFVWKPVQVRDLIDSLYHGYPTGFLITWKNPDVKIKGGGKALGKTVLIDGQQRVTAIMTALAGQEVIRDDYERSRIKIAFNPLHEESESPFEVLSNAIAKDKRWIHDISALFKPDFDSWSFVNSYIAINEDADPKAVNSAIGELRAIALRQMGCITLNADCTIDEVTQIFIRVNSKGTALSQADFAMSKIASDEIHGGYMLRKGIDYFCHLAVKPEFWDTISKHDLEYMSSDFAKASSWVHDSFDDIFVPRFGDVLRVAFMYKFSRGKLADLVSLLSGRDFEKREYRSEIADDSFARLKDGVLHVIARPNFVDFASALKSAGFISSSMITSMNAVDFAFNLYLRLRDDKSVAATDVKRWVQRWFVMSVLTRRYSSSPETAMDRDIRTIEERGFMSVYQDVTSAQLSDTFWEVELPQMLETSSNKSPAWLVYLASQVRAADNTLFTCGFKVADLIDDVGDVHHIFPKAYLKRELGATTAQMNQVANYALLEKRVNIAIGDRAPSDYFGMAAQCCEDGSAWFGDIGSPEELERNLRANCIPEGIIHMDAGDYARFLRERRTLMAGKIRRYFESL